MKSTSKMTKMLLTGGLILLMVFSAPPVLAQQDTTPPTFVEAFTWIKENCYKDEAGYYLLGGTVYVDAYVTDNGGVFHLSFYAGEMHGIYYAVFSGRPEARSSFPWDSSWVNDGKTFLRIYACDMFVNVSTATIDVIIDNTPPEVTIISPEEGDVVEGTIDISIEATDENLYNKIECKYYDALHPDGYTIKESSESPLTFRWDTTQIPDGWVVLRAYATDKVGWEGYKEVSITIDNSPPADTTPPTLEIIIFPEWGDIVKGAIDISIAATDENLDKIGCKYNGHIIGESSESTLSFEWDTTTVTDGSVYLEAYAIDKADNEDTYTVRITIDNTPPEPPTTCQGWSDGSKTTAITSGETYSFPIPYFEWAGAYDAESGIDGYYVYYGTNQAAEPEDQGEFQAGNTHYVSGSKMRPGNIYYLRIKTVDRAGNTSDVYNAFTYRYCETFLSSVEGTVQIKWNGEWHDAHSGDCLQDGDAVRTWQNSTAEITLADGGKIRLKPSGHYRLEWRDPCWELKTFLGRMWALFFKPVCFRVNTPSGGGAVRGTEFTVQVAGDGTSTFVVLDGVVDVWDLAEIKTVSVGQYQTTTVEPNGLPSDPQSIDPNQINRWWEDIGPKLSADFDLVCVYKTPLHTTEFDASTQTVKPEWWLAVENEGEPNDPNWVIDSVTFQAPYELFDLYPAPNDVNEFNYSWHNITLAPDDYFEIEAEQETETADVNFPYTITRTFTGNYITGAGELTTTVTVTPEPNISGLEVEISLYAAQSEQAWEEGKFFGTLGHVSNSGDPNESEHWGSAYARHYEWEIWDGYTPGELLTFSCTVHVDLNADIDWALIEPEVRVGGSMLTDAYSENWANNTVQLPNGGTISIDSTELANDTDVFIPWIEVYMPQYAAVNLHDIAHFASRWLSTCYE